MTLSNKTPNLFHKLRILSIDVVLGALSGGVMAVKVFGLQIEIVWWFVLATAVWIIYTADHLIDSNKLGSDTSSVRRLFYYKHFKLIMIIEIIIILITAFISLLLLKNSIIIFGVFMGVFVAVYLLLVQLIGSKQIIWLQKELIVAFVYTAGIWGVPVLYSTQAIALYQVVLIISFFLIVWADILIIAQFEIENDRADDFSSLPVIIGKEKNTKLIKGILLFSIFTLLVFVQKNEFIMVFAGVILLVMSFVLFILLKHEAFFKKKDRYRIFAESVFFLPALMLVV